MDFIWIEILPENVKIFNGKNWKIARALKILFSLRKNQFQIINEDIYYRVKIWEVIIHIILHL